jgi:hypothetical protein
MTPLTLLLTSLSTSLLASFPTSLPTSLPMLGSSHFCVKTISSNPHNCFRKPLRFSLKKIFYITFKGFKPLKKKSHKGF